ncbi:hypothetical protein EDC14_103728 [Hydrogenispora ethanolica]|jgi:hypothetical protein|uniref:Uncharacterized protein n=1 Tax=Hydrogenispora ethanolica TaxID=1082276 RepID=A0A4R1R314_HYDET|nr:hypothetical protein [Hydrogenispora ethanolica]TCL59791.1 hypothetical protein EDC14_103728 [Hydrogenispora ethanolica]
MEYFFQTRAELGLHELQNDLLFGKIPPERYPGLIEGAWQTGREAALRYSSQYGTSNPEELAVRLGLTLVEQEQGWIAPEYRICSEYYSNPRQIILYRDTICGELEKLKAKGISRYESYAAIRPLFIAHELFHHIECHDIGLTSRRDKLIVLQWGPFRVTSGIKALSEIGAHGFTKALLNLEEEADHEAL